MVKATIRKPAPVTGKPITTVNTKPVVRDTGGRLGSIDVESKLVDSTSANELADQLDAGVPVPGSEEEVSQQTSAPTALTARPRGTVARALPQGAESGLEGDWDSGDLKLPQLKIVNGSGELSQKFNQGTLLYADEKLWGPPNLEPGAKNPFMFFVPIQIKKQYRENLTQSEVEEGLMPRVVNSAVEAESLTGEGSTQWVANQKPRWSPSARCVFLLKAPEGCEHPAFCQPLDGEQWALAVFYAGGTAYNESAKQIFNAAQISLKENGKIVLPKKVWTFEVIKKKAGQFTVFVPKLRLTKEETGPEARELCNQILGVKNIQAQE